MQNLTTKILKIVAIAYTDSLITEYNKLKPKINDLKKKEKRFKKIKSELQEIYGKGKTNIFKYTISNTQTSRKVIDNDLLHFLFGKKDFEKLLKPITYFVTSVKPIKAKKTTKKRTKSKTKSKKTIKTPEDQKREEMLSPIIIN